MEDLNNNESSQIVRSCYRVFLKKVFHECEENNARNKDDDLAEG